MSYYCYIHEVATRKNIVNNLPLHHQAFQNTYVELQS